MSIGRDRHNENRQVHSSVYHRDRWTCRMPVCLHPGGRAIDPALRGADSPWAPSIDHVREIVHGGPNEKWNMRAAHRECNSEDARDLGRKLTRDENVPVPLANSIGDLFPVLRMLVEHSD